MRAERGEPSTWKVVGVLSPLLFPAETPNEQELESVPVPADRTALSRRQKEISLSCKRCPTTSNVIILHIFSYYSSPARW